MITYILTERGCQLVVNFWGCSFPSVRSGAGQEGFSAIKTLSLDLLKREILIDS